MPESLVFLVMAVAFVLAAALGKLPIGISLILAAVAGALAGGEGVPVRHLIEGSFGYFDVILIILSAILFMKVLQAIGTLDSLAAFLLRTFHRRKALLLFTSTAVIMFPGMITGSSTVSVLTAGPLVAPVLMRLGLSHLKTGALIAMAAILGMIAPPINILVMIMGGGVDMPYVGVTLPLLVLVIPPAIAIPLWIGYKDVRVLELEELETILPRSWFPEYGWRLILPLVVVLGLMAGQRTLVQYIPDLGIPGIFMLGSLLGIVCGRRFNFWSVTQKAVEEAMPILAILVGVGMFIQIMTLTGGRGWTVVSLLSLPSVLLYPAMSLGMVAFGGVSSFGSASILGVPFVLALIGKNAILTSTALSAIASLGDLVPPTALAGIFAAQVVEEKQYMKVMRYCIVPALFILAMGLAVLLLATPLERILL
ncbi:MAG: TRAP transporter large permease subunit [Gemmatimonadota bacterium]